MPCRKEYAMETKDPKAIVDCLEEKFGEDLSVDIFKEQKGGIHDEAQLSEIWVTISKGRFKELVNALFEFDFPHFHTISGNDDGDVISLYYHFSLFRVAERGKRICMTVRVAVPKDDLVVSSLFDEIPGVEYAEREIREMLGVDFDGLPDKALVFLPEDWDQTIKPWRRDEEGPGPEVVRELS